MLRQVKQACRQGASFGFFHDMLVTENYYVLLENPITLDLQKLLTRYMFGRACLAECLEFRPDRRTRVHLLRRPGRQGAYGVSQRVRGSGGQLGYVAFKESTCALSVLQGACQATQGLNVA